MNDRVRSRRQWLGIAAGLTCAGLAGHASARWWVRRSAGVPREPVLTAREGRVAVALSGHEPGLGTADPLVTIVEFAAYHCGHCAAAHAPVSRAVAEYADDVRLVFKHYPLNRDKDGILAALSGFAAHQQSAFWRFTEALYARGGRLEGLETVVADLGLDEARFFADMRSESAAAAIDADRLAGGKLGIRGTPTFVVNGHIYQRNWQIDDWRQVLGAELAVARSLVARGVPRAAVYETITTAEASALPS